MGAPARSAAKYYNFAVELIEPNLERRPNKLAFVDERGAYSFAATAKRVDRVGAALLALDLAPGDRVILCLHDGIDFVATFLGAVKAGLVPIPLNTLLTAEDYAYMLTDSEARAVVVSGALASKLAEAIAACRWRGALIISGEYAGVEGAKLDALMSSAPGELKAHPSRADDVAFWLYSSGSTGRPKGAPHRHASPVQTAELFGRNTFGLCEDDIVYSAAKLFFAYGLGNALTFTMRVGATAVLFPGRVTPDVVTRLITDHGVTVFCGAPTLFGALLAANKFPLGNSLRLCMSAGEGLPEEIGKAWSARTGVDIIDGIGSTEMLHIFVSNRPGAVRYGATGWPVEGYEVKLIDEAGLTLGPDEIGELWVRGPTTATHYWNQPEKTAATFVDGWMKTGDKFLMHQDGCLQHLGRTDDMIKVSGVWVSPSEVESALLAHEAVLEAAVIGVADESGLTKTKAFVVLREGHPPSEALAQTLKDHTKTRLAPFKYPRSIEFVSQLPRTATGKIRRHVLREIE